ncbi:hypothetical protein MP228_006528 [Amoeboaphelidium protococcarum]|nr:hypothetical protein MP228_006528 [Amoeboaphelidium protococcarum]
MNFPFAPQSNLFIEQFRAYPISRIGASRAKAVEHTGKILMPSSCLLKLAQLHIEYPMLFKLSLIKKSSTDGSQSQMLHTHVGVLEFTAEEGRVYLPKWIYDQFGLSTERGDTPLITLTNVTLPLGTFVKIEPQSVDFLDITDPKAVLENALRNYSTLSKGDIISILYNEKVYKLKLLEIKPDTNGAISIVETDLSVDFAPPVGYVDPSEQNMGSAGRAIKSRDSQMSFHSAHSIGIDEHKVDRRALKQQKSSSSSSGTVRTTFEGTQGAGQRLNGKSLDKPSAITGGKVVDFTKIATGSGDSDNNAPTVIRLPKNKLWFGYPIKEYKKDEGKEEGGGGNKPDSDSFKGVGFSLRKSTAVTSQ